MRPISKKRKGAKLRAKPKPKIPKIPLKRKKVSSTYFKDNAEKKSFSFKEVPEWQYEEKHYHPKGMPSYYSNKSHLVLRDGAGQVRFTLRFDYYPGQIIVRSVQRERTVYEKEEKGNRMVWSPEMENHASKFFKRQLGMHPAEFLLSEFILRNKKKILAGHRLILDLDLSFEHFPKVNKIYQPLVDRFFKKKSILKIGKIGTVFELSLRKKRVKAILGLS